MPKSQYMLKIHIPVDISGTIVGESLDCLLLSGTVVGENRPMSNDRYISVIGLGRNRSFDYDPVLLQVV